jgi:hypothetical protein
VDIVPASQCILSVVVLDLSSLLLLLLVLPLLVYHFPLLQHIGQHLVATVIPKAMCNDPVMPVAFASDAVREPARAMHPQSTTVHRTTCQIMLLCTKSSFLSAAPSLKL